MSSKVSTVKILYDNANDTGVTTTGAGESFEPFGENRSFQLVGNTSAGAGAAQVDVEVSNDGSNWIKAGKLSLVLSTTVAKESMLMKAPWRYVRGNVISISGTDAEVTLTMGNLV